MYPRRGQCVFSAIGRPGMAAARRLRIGEARAPPATCGDHRSGRTTHGQSGKARPTHCRALQEMRPRPAGSKEPGCTRPQFASFRRAAAHRNDRASVGIFDTCILPPCTIAVLDCQLSARAHPVLTVMLDGPSCTIPAGDAEVLRRGHSDFRVLRKAFGSLQGLGDSVARRRELCGKARPIHPADNDVALISPFSAVGAASTLRLKVATLVVGWLSGSVSRQAGRDCAIPRRCDRAAPISSADRR
jgi:hypothetical protein